LQLKIGNRRTSVVTESANPNQPESKATTMSDGKPAPQNIQDAFLNTIRRDKATVTVYLVNGAKLLARFAASTSSPYCSNQESQEQLIFKHAISTISLAKRYSGELRGSPDAQDATTEPPTSRQS
jgi:host factor-I protein